MGLAPSWVLALPAAMCCVPPILIAGLTLMAFYLFGNGRRKNDAKKRVVEEDVIDAEYEVLEE